MARLSTQERKGLAASSFAEPGKRAYPINDESHARNALARVAQHGSPAEKTQVRAAVHRRYPDIGVSGMDKAMSNHADKMHPVKRG